MALPKFNMRELIEAGVHFGHKTRRWNPKMSPFIYGERNNIHIIDLQKTVPLLNRALKTLQEHSAKHGRILFVGTKRQASDLVKEAAERCGQYYVNERWLGGMLTNWKTIQNSIRQLKKLEEQLANEESLNLTKKEILKLQRQHDKLQSSLGGIRDMSGLPSVIFIIDVIREELAVKEANKLGIPVVAIVDSNAELDGIDYPIPGNDDAIRAIRMYCKLTSDAVLSGIEASLAEETDMGAQAEPEAVEEVAEVVEAPKEAEKKTVAKSSTKKEAMAEVAKKKSESKAEEAPKEEAKVDAKEEKPAKKPAAKKPAAKKAASKKDADAKEKKAEKKPAAKKAPAKKAAAKKPAAKKADAKDAS